MKNKGVIWVIVVLVMCLIGTSVLLYQEKQQETQAFRSLLNRFYVEVDKSLHITSLIIENDTADDEYIERLFINLEVSLNNMTTLLDFVEFAVDDTNFPNGDFAAIASYTSVEDYGEVAYVRRVKEMLTDVKQAMYSEEHNQEDPNLTPEAFNTIVEEATNQAWKYFN
ncbi:hypothetical protein [Halolactibacillus miurensis]|nr:hypothetical protein [Halolactibacillus miurensis]